MDSSYRVRKEVSMDYRDLPYDAEIEYLESTGTQWIYPDYNSGNSSIISIAAQLTSLTAQRRIIGNDSGYFEIYITGGINWGAASNGATTSSNITADTNAHIFKIDNVANKAYLDNSSWNITHNGASYYNKVGLFGRLNNNVGCTGRIYSAQIYEGSVLVRDLIPVRVGNVGYMYDRVSGQLFSNQGTGSFVLGPDVAPGRYANEVAFLESWGNQYIDTGIKPSTDTKIELKCLYCKSGAGLTNYGALIGADDRDNAYILNHSAVANFTYGIEFSNNFANPQTRLFTFDSTASPQNMRVYDEGGSLVTTLTCIRGVFEVNQNLYLFAVNRNGTPVYGSNRIMYCKIYDGDTLVRDYVPVEYNGIGYMYDKVSGLFFDNQGTGKFLFGSIAKACARSYTRRQLMMDVVAVKPYISNGLVMHFDGADFDGTTTWNSRVGGFVATKAGSGSIVKTSDGGVEFVGGSSANNPRCFTINKVVNVANTVGTIEICAYRKAKSTAFIETILDWGTINNISYKINGNQTAVMISNYTSNSPSAPITYDVGKFTHSINNDRQVWNGQNKALGANGNLARGGNTIGGRNNGSGQWNFIGVIYQIRIYNRKLSEAEMKWNQEQDRKRYGIQF